MSSIMAKSTTSKNKKTTSSKAPESRARSTASGKAPVAAPQVVKAAMAPTAADAVAAAAPAAEPVVTEIKTSVGGREMKKREFIDRVAKRGGLRKNQVKPVVEALFAVLAETLASGTDLNVPPLGKIKVNKQKTVAGGQVLMLKVRTAAAPVFAEDGASVVDQLRSGAEAGDTDEDGENDAEEVSEALAEPAE